MHRIRKVKAPSGGDTDNVAAESPVDHTDGVPIDEKAAQTTASDLPHSSAHDAETGLKKFEVLHAFDPNLPGEIPSHQLLGFC
jgi:hypothetical protein